MKSLSSPAHGIDISLANIKEKAGEGGGATSMKFDMMSTKSDGSSCVPCTLCDGHVLRSVFDPKVSSTCFDCSSQANPCDEIRIISTFGKEWGITFFTLVSSAMDSTS